MNVINECFFVFSMFEKVCWKNGFGLDITLLIQVYDLYWFMNYDDLACYPRYIDLLFLLVGESRVLSVILHLVKQSETVILFSLQYISEGLVAGLLFQADQW